MARCNFDNSQISAQDTLFDIMYHIRVGDIDDSVQDCSISIADARKIL